MITFADTMTATRGIVLMNLGSPDSTEVKDVRKYLNEFLMDEKVIDVPYLLRLFLVRGIIVPFRAHKSAHAYETIWTKQGSPLIQITKELERELQQQIEEPIEIAMRYGNPSSESAFNNLLKRNPGIEEVVLLPLYPHYAMSSYETAVDHAREIYRKNRYSFKLTVIKPYYNDADYIAALAASIQPFLEQEYDHVLFSYHGVPERHIYKGDVTKQHCLKFVDCCEVDSVAHSQCYRHQCITTTKLVAASLHIPENKFSLSFQSRLGRDEWLKPYTSLRLEELPKQGIKRLLIACPAFVSDCLETLEEIAIQGKETFMNAGGESYTVTPCLNLHPLWIAAITNWLKEYKSGNSKLVAS